MKRLRDRPSIGNALMGHWPMYMTIIWTQFVNGKRMVGSCVAHITSS